MAVFTMFLVVVLPMVVCSESKEMFLGNGSTYVVLTSLEAQVNFSETLNLTVEIGGNVDLVKNKIITLNGTESGGIVPSCSSNVFVMSTSLKKNITVTFSSDEAPKPLRNPVNISITLSVLNRSTSVTVGLIDDRVEIGFSPEAVAWLVWLPCHPNETCLLSIHTVKPASVATVNVTLTLMNSKKENVSEIGFSLMNGDRNSMKPVMARETGYFTATLSVHQSHQKRVHWITRELPVPVVRNQMEERLDNLTTEFTELKSDYDKLKSEYDELNLRYQDLSTSLMNSGEAHSQAPSQSSTQPQSPTEPQSTTEPQSPPQAPPQTTPQSPPQTTPQSPSQNSSQALSPTSSQPSPESPSHRLSTEDTGDNTLLYGGLVVFIAVLMLCVAVYVAYHNKDKILGLFGWKKESVVEMAMRSRTKKSRGYQRLPVSVHDTVTHED